MASELVPQFTTYRELYQCLYHNKSLEPSIIDSLLSTSQVEPLIEAIAFLLDRPNVDISDINTITTTTLHNHPDNMSYNNDLPTPLTLPASQLLSSTSPLTALTPGFRASEFITRTNLSLNYYRGNLKPNLWLSRALFQDNVEIIDLFRTIRTRYWDSGDNFRLALQTSPLQTIKHKQTQYPYHLLPSGYCRDVQKAAVYDLSWGNEAQKNTIHPSIDNTHITKENDNNPLQSFKGDSLSNWLGTSMPGEDVFSVIGIDNAKVLGLYDDMNDDKVSKSTVQVNWILTNASVISNIWQTILRANDVSALDGVFGVLSEGLRVFPEALPEPPSSSSTSTITTQSSNHPQQPYPTIPIMLCDTVTRWDGIQMMKLMDCYRYHYDIENLEQQILNLSSQSSLNTTNNDNNNTSSNQDQLLQLNKELYVYKEYSSRAKETFMYFIERFGVTMFTPIQISTIYIFAKSYQDYNLIAILSVLFGINDDNYLSYSVEMRRNALVTPYKRETWFNHFDPTTMNDSPLNSPPLLTKHEIPNDITSFKIEELIMMVYYLAMKGGLVKFTDLFMSLILISTKTTLITWFSPSEELTPTDHHITKTIELLLKGGDVHLGLFDEGLQQLLINASQSSQAFNRSSTLLNKFAQLPIEILQTFIIPIGNSNSNQFFNAIFGMCFGYLWDSDTNNTQTITTHLPFLPSPNILDYFISTSSHIHSAIPTLTLPFKISFDQVMMMMSNRLPQWIEESVIGGPQQNNTDSVLAFLSTFINHSNTSILDPIEITDPVKFIGQLIDIIGAIGQSPLGAELNITLKHRKSIFITQIFSILTPIISSIKPSQSNQQDIEDNLVKLIENLGKYGLFDVISLILNSFSKVIKTASRSTISTILFTLLTADFALDLRNFVEVPDIYATLMEINEEEGSGSEDDDDDDDDDDNKKTTQPLFSIFSPSLLHSPDLSPIFSMGYPKFSPSSGSGYLYGLENDVLGVSEKFGSYKDKRDWLEGNMDVIKSLAFGSNHPSTTTILSNPHYIAKEMLGTNNNGDVIQGCIDLQTFSYLSDFHTTFTSHPTSSLQSPDINIILPQTIKLFNVLFKLNNDITNEYNRIPILTLLEQFFTIFSFPEDDTPISHPLSTLFHTPTDPAPYSTKLIQSWFIALSNWSSPLTLAVMMNALPLYVQSSSFSWVSGYGEVCKITSQSTNSSSQLLGKVIVQRYYVATDLINLIGINNGDSKQPNSPIASLVAKYISWAESQSDVEEYFSARKEYLDDVKPLCNKLSKDPQHSPIISLCGYYDDNLTQLNPISIQSQSQPSDPFFQQFPLNPLPQPITLAGHKISTKAQRFFKIGKINHIFTRLQKAQNSYRSLVTTLPTWFSYDFVQFVNSSTLGSLGKPVNRVNQVKGFGSNTNTLQSTQPTKSLQQIDNIITNLANNDNDIPIDLSQVASDWGEPSEEESVITLTPFQYQFTNAIISSIVHYITLAHQNTKISLGHSINNLTQVSLLAQHYNQSGFQSIPPYVISLLTQYGHFDDESTLLNLQDLFLYQSCGLPFPLSTQNDQILSYIPTWESKRYPRLNVLRTIIMQMVYGPLYTTAIFAPLNMIRTYKLMKATSQCRKDDLIGFKNGNATVKTISESNPSSSGNLQSVLSSIVETDHLEHNSEQIEVNGSNNFITTLLYLGSMVALGAGAWFVYKSNNKNDSNLMKTKE